MWCPPSFWCVHRQQPVKAAGPLPFRQRCVCRGREGVRVVGINGTLNELGVPIRERASTRVTCEWWPALRGHRGPTAEPLSRTPVNVSQVPGKIVTSRADKVRREEPLTLARTEWVQAFSRSRTNASSRASMSPQAYP